MKNNKAFKFRLRPNEQQKILIGKTIGCSRHIWNKMLEDKEAHYKETKKLLRTTPAKYKDKYPFLREVDSLALANVQLNLERSYAMYFKGKAGLPNFKSKKRDYGYTTNLVNGNIELTLNSIKLPKLGVVKCRVHRTIPSGYTLKSATISKSKTNKYYVSVLYEYYEEPKVIDIKDTLGLDFDIMNFFIDSNNNKYDYPKDIIMDYKKLRVLQRTMSRRYDKNKKITEQSKNFYKVQLQIAKVYEKIVNKRNDYLHKLSLLIAKEHDSVSVETLDIKAIASSNKFYGKQIGRFGWYKFIELLKYKLEERGKKLIMIDKWYPSSKACSNCAYVKADLKVGEQVYKCDECGFTICRDLNASINIKNKGLEQLGLA